MHVLDPNVPSKSRAVQRVAECPHLHTPAHTERQVMKAKLIRQMVQLIRFQLADQLERQPLHESLHQIDTVLVDAALEQIVEGYLVDGEWTRPTEGGHELRGIGGQMLFVENARVFAAAV